MDTIPRGRRAKDAPADQPRTKLEKLLQQQGLTAYALHQALIAQGHVISLRAVYDHAAGKKLMTLRNAVAYAKALGVHAEKLAE
jgi:hypothetical protein